jgi:hypothetical protein
MTVKRFSTLFCQLTGLVMFASLSIWSISTFAACGTVTNGLVACYPFEGNANDASGNGNNGTKYGDVVYVPGKIGQAAKFDGLGDYIDIANSVALNPAQLTISAWIQVANLSMLSGDPTSVNHHIVFNKENQYELAMFGSAYSPDKISAGEISFALNPYYPSWFWIPTGNFPELQQFKHVVLTFDQNSVAKLYVNGQKVKENPYPSALKPTSGCLRIGARGCPSTANAFFNGLIDELRIYNRAITDAEITQLYNEANPEPVVCAPANYTNGVLKVPFITIDGVTDTYKATMQQYNSGFAFRVTESAVITGKSNCPATYSPTTGILHIPLVKTKSAIPLNTFQCYDVTLQAFSNRFQLDLETLKVIKCP